MIPGGKVHDGGAQVVKRPEVKAGCEAGQLKVTVEKLHLDTSG